MMAVLLSCGLSACHHNKAAEPTFKRYPFTGRVVALDPSSQSAVIDGDAIPGFMDAMAMTYKVKAGAEFKKLSVGDAISAEVVVAEPSPGDNDAVGESWIENIRITGHVKEPPARPAAHIPSPGEQVPDFAFVNQDGRRISLSQYRSQTILLTLIYVRCPFPDFCPRVSHEFAAAYHQLETDPALNKIHLLSLSFDPAHDSPQALREYAFSLAGTKDANLFHRWEFATARASDLPKLADFFAFSYKEEGGLITHSLSTAVIGPDGKIVSWRHDGEWHASDLLKDAASASN